MMTFGQLAEQFARGARQCRPALELDLAEIGEAASHIAKDLIGQEFPGWPPLAPSTIAEKTRLGYVGQVSATDPLLRTGSLRDSITFEVEELAVTVGSPEPVAAYQEFGTSRGIPPRPVFMSSVMLVEPVAESILGETVVKLLTGTER